MVGGFLAIMGHLNIGQLVAVISAYKDLPSPVKDLIDWDQQRLDVEVKYNQVIEQFSVDPSVELLPPPDYRRARSRTSTGEARADRRHGARQHGHAAARQPVASRSDLDERVGDRGQCRPAAARR